jgi:hypothetical protein
MTQYRKQQTLNLFFKKYPYKIEVRLALAYLFRYKSPAELIVHWNKNSTKFLEEFYVRKRSTDGQIERFFEFCHLMTVLDKDRYRLRIQHSSVSIYLETKDEFDCLCTSIEKFIVKVTEPANLDLVEFLKENKKKIICKSLPHGKYTYRITLRSMPDTIRHNLFEWSQKYTDDQMLLSPSTIRYLSGNFQWCYTPYIYVSDPKLLLMIGLAAQGYVSKTEEFIVRSSINTSL